MKGENMEEVKRIDLIPPRELKTVEIDVEKKIFRVNGEDFGKVVSGFVLNCTEPKDREKDWFKVFLTLKTDIRYSSEYNLDGKMTSEPEAEQ